MRIQDEQLKRFILDAGLITKTDIVAAEKIAKDENRSLGEALIAHGHMTEDDMRRVESYVLGIPFVSLKDIKIGRASARRRRTRARLRRFDRGAPCGARRG